jgi:hypothetical protein
LADATDAVNMLFKDGDQYTFIHRSFQEYFTAYAITHYFVKPIRNVIPRIPRRESDSVFSMARSMNTAVIDEFYLLPEYGDRQKDVMDILRLDDPLEVLKSLDYVVNFGFEVRSGIINPFMYSMYSISELDIFINTVYMMFRDFAPKELDGGFGNRGVMRTMRSIAGAIQGEIDTSIDGRVINVFLSIDDMSVRVELEEAFGAIKADREQFTISLDRMDWKKNFSAILSAGQRAKGRCVFAKRKIDEIRKNYRKARETSDDILSM